MNYYKHKLLSSTCNVIHQSTRAIWNTHTQKKRMNLIGNFSFTPCCNPYSVISVCYALTLSRPMTLTNLIFVYYISYITHHFYIYIVYYHGCTFYETITISISRTVTLIRQNKVQYHILTIHLNRLWCIKSCH